MIFKRNRVKRFFYVRYLLKKISKNYINYRLPTLIAPFNQKNRAL
ncbi:hypothetical protein P20429_2244 [Pseudoalteromonas sp. BSi20429]|nr:hypothetical protein P20429_2244 [Pseudoalteromonas sp. BSi20429]